MEQVKAPKKALFVLVWGVLVWGGSTALAITLFDRYTHQIEAPFEVVVRFVLFMAGGILWGLWMWNGREVIGRRERTRTGIILRTVLFIGVMTGLAYALVTMIRR